MNDFKYDATSIPIEKLSISEGNIRKLCVEAEELIPSIRKEGVREPLHVYQNKDDRFAIIDGQRRFLAAKKIGLTSLPCIIHPEIENEAQAKEYSFIQTLLKKDANPLDKAKAIREMKTKLGTLQKVHEKYGIPISTLSQYDSLNDLDPEVQDMMKVSTVETGKPLPYKKALEIAKLPKDRQLELAQKVLYSDQLETQKILWEEKSRLKGIDKQLNCTSETRIPLLVSFPKDTYSSLEKASGAKGLKKEDCVQAIVIEFLETNGFLKSNPQGSRGASK